MIDDFKATLGKRGFAKPTLFRVELVKTPQILLNIEGVSEIVRDLHFFAETAEFPGTQILTQEIRYYDMPEKIAYGKAHDELNITFRVDRDYQVKRLFDAWVNSIYDRQTGDIYYKHIYAGGLQIYQIMENGFSSYVIEFEDLFPTQVGQISLGWDQSGTYTRLPVTFSFKRMRTIANKMIFRKPSFGPNESNKGVNTFSERTIKEPLNQVKTTLSPLLDYNVGALRQVEVMNKTGFSRLFNGLDFV